MKKEQSLQNFFDETLTEMLMQSPAVKNLHPLLQKVMMKNLKSGNQQMKQQVLKILLTESHEYVELAAKFKEKYGSDPESYIRKIETMASKIIAEENEKGERAAAETKIKTISS